MIRNWYNQIPYPSLKTQRESTKYINWQQFTKDTRGKPNEQLFPRQMVIQLHKLKYVTHIIGEPKYKYCGSVYGPPNVAIMFTWSSCFMLACRGITCHDDLKWASSWDNGTYHIGDQQRLSPEPSLFAHMKYGSRRRVRPKIRHLAIECLKNEFR